MPRTRLFLSDLDDSLRNMLGGSMQLIEKSLTTTSLPIGANVVDIDLGTAKVLLKTIRVTPTASAPQFSVEILNKVTDGSVEYNSLDQTAELYDMVDLPYVDGDGGTKLHLRINNQVESAYTIQIRALPLS